MLTDPAGRPADRLEWLAKRAEVLPLHLAAHILADGRTVKAESCYAFLRAELPALLRASDAAWRAPSQWLGSQRVFGTGTRDVRGRPTSPANEHAKRAWAMFTPPLILHRKSFPLRFDITA